jgi:hypothetical protein
MSIPLEKVRASLFPTVFSGVVFTTIELLVRLWKFQQHALKFIGGWTTSAFASTKTSDVSHEISRLCLRSSENIERVVRETRKIQKKPAVFRCILYES